MDKTKTCCFSGHRPNKLPWGGNENDARCLALKAELAARLDGLYEAGYSTFICGMAIGCDMYFAEAVLELRKKHPEVRLEAAVPCGTQPDRWARPLRQRYNELLNASNKVTLLSVNYTPDCMMRRNKYMVDSSSLLLCCYNGRPGGTMSTILYAERSGLDVIIIDI